ncbi:MAG: flagellar basal body rod protein FlgB [Clostridiaceae bacterium]|nr:flagellar basal body rod protein FlgB [Clostridiaceae bacterium]
MLGKLLFPNKKLENSLDAAWLRNDVISQNIANADTPGYKRKEEQFEEYLNSEMKHSRIENGMSRLSGGKGIKVVNDHENYSYRLDGNNIDIEREMAQMAMNTLRYNTLIQRMNGQFAKLRNVIKGR